MKGIAFDPAGRLWGTHSERGAAGLPGIYAIDASTGAATLRDTAGESTTTTRIIGVLF